MTTEVEPVPFAPHLRVRSRIAHSLMRFAPLIRWAEPELRGLGALVRPGDEVLDIGASHGMYTVPLAHLVGPAGKVFSFEPHPRQQRSLRRLKRLLGFRQLSITPAAIGTSEGEFTMRMPIKYGFPIYGHAHITSGAADYPDTVKTRTWRTAMTSIDGWAARSHPGRIRFIKIDVEGFEPSVIEGGSELIARDLPSLLVEIEDRHLARYGRTANGFADEIRTTWPAYGMYVWKDETWVAADRVDFGIRNYLFATDAAFAR
ncbi:MAG TPA: FkbM family methyltransferase [Pseudolysinimonas sp.]|nr:FkbM family methyltransferase [Pseudolysinimonas sp.]